MLPTGRDLAGSLERRFGRLPNGVRSLAIIQRGRIARAFKDRKQRMLIEDSYVVTDLLNDLSYLVTPAGSQIQLLFALNEAFVAVDMDLGSDPLELAEIITKLLLGSGTSFS
jgi:hypothetical protein